MLAPMKDILSKHRIVLASSSPRRQELVKTIGLDAELCPSTFEENLRPCDFKEFCEFIEATALGKAEEVYQRLQCTGDARDLIVIAADTTKKLGDEVYGKSKDLTDAVRMLTNLSGNCNRAFTGVVIRHKNGCQKFTETTDVYFGDLTKEQIQAYADSGDPLDKAGAYGIGGPGGAMISRIEGDFYCVKGVCVELCKLLTEENA